MSILATIKGIAIVSKFSGFMGPVWAKHKGKIIVLLLALCVAGYIWMLKNDLEDMTDKYNQALRDYSVLNTTCKSNEAEYKSAIETQNKANEELAEKLRIAQEGIDKANAAAAIAAEKSKKELEAIMKEAKPTTCEGAIEFLHDGKEDLKW